MHHAPVCKSHKNFQKIFIVLFIKNNYNNLLLIGIHKKNLLQLWKKNKSQSVI